MATDNAARAGVAVTFTRAAASDLTPPSDTAPGLVIVNPPYCARIGERKLLFSLYGALGKTLLERFSGWRVGIITSDGGLAKATGLPLLPTEGPIAHGGLKVQLYRTDPLPLRFRRRQRALANCWFCSYLRREEHLCPALSHFQLPACIARLALAAPRLRCRQFRA